MNASRCFSGCHKEQGGRLLAAGPVSRIRRAALQTDNLFEISRREVSMMSTSAVMAGFASHRRHKFSDFTA
jgi:hypothetical protein